jgi:arylsulfatase A-like enzyme
MVVRKILRKIVLMNFVVVMMFGCKEKISSDNHQRPNILFIMSNDHAYQAISAYSNRLIETPNIDRIADEEMLFNNACVTNSICAPSCAVILTGKHNHLNGKTDNIFPFDTTQVTFPILFQEAGYQSALFGKLHFGNSPKGFDEFKILPGQGTYYNTDFITKNEGIIHVEEYTTDIITDMTLNWLDKERDITKPFLMMYLHKAPRREWLPAERHYKEFTKRKFPEPETLFDNYKSRGTDAKTAEMNILTHMNWAGDSKIRPELMDELGLTINTLVIFTSDHGEMLGAHGMREKNVFYEESSHIPLLIRFPGEIESGTVVDGYISLVDLFPTILDYLKIEEHPSDGKSLRGLIEGTDLEHGKYVVTEWDYRGDIEPNYMIIKDGWKLIIPYSKTSKVINAMYNLNDDSYEMKNLIGKNPKRKEYEGQAEELRECLLEWLKKNNSKHYNGVKERELI